MKKIVLSILFFVVSGCAFMERSDQVQRTNPVTERDVPVQARDTDMGLRKRIVVLPFIDEKISRPQGVLEAARSSVVRQLNNTKRFVIVRNEDLPQAPAAFMNENRQYDLEKLAPIAANIGTAALLEGKILEIKAKRMGDEVGLIRKIRAQVEATVRIRVISARNGRLVLDETRTGVIETDTTRVGEYSFSDRFLEDDPAIVEKAVQKAFTSSIVSVVKSVDKLSWEGRVAMVQGERVFVNAGRLSGIQIGDVLKVTEEGNEVFDPESGEFIGQAPGRMKGTVEVVTYFGKDGAIGVVHSGSGFKENDKVELY